MEPISFKTFLNYLGEGSRVSGKPPAHPITSISIDTRTMNAGAVYFALKGDRFDGHQFVGTAFKNGALACVVDKDWEPENPLPEQNTLIYVKDSLQALQALAANYRQQFDLPIVAITGTNGKTTTKEMTAAVLEQNYQLIKTPGNYNNHIGLPLTLMQIDKSSEMAIVEMGANHFGEIEFLSKLARPTHGLITNIGAGHLEFFGSVEKVAVAKAELFENLSEDGVAFINADDPRILREKCAGRKQLSFGCKNADVTGRLLRIDEDGCVHFVLQEQVEIGLKVPGKHQLYNALAAAAVGIHFDVPLEKIAAALSGFTSYSKRMEKHDFAQKTILLDAYNSNPDSLSPALETLSKLAKSSRGRAVAVLGDMLELGKLSSQAHFQGGEEAAKLGVHALFLYGQYAEDCKNGYSQSGNGDVFIFSDKNELAKKLHTYLQKNDVVLIKGSRGVAMETVWKELQEMSGS